MSDENIRLAARNLELEAIEHFRILEKRSGKKLDPNNEHDWSSVALGYFVAKGFGFSRCIDMAIAVHYGELAEPEK